MKGQKILTICAFAFAVIAVSPAQTPPSGEVRAALNKLVMDTKAALADSTVTQAQFQSLKSSVAVAIDGANRPSSSSVKKLAATIEMARQDGAITDQERALISKAFAAVLASANIPLSEAAAVRDSLAVIITAAHVTPDEASLILSDLRALLEALPEARRP